jgi:GT2 family glycosyltransferase
MKRKENVLIVIPVYNRQDDLVILMDSLLKIELDKFDICIAIIDDNSLIPVTINKKWEKFEVRIFRNTNNMGPAYSRNLAVRMINSDYIWFLDSDAEILNPKILVNIANVLASNDRICATGGIIENIRGQNMILEGKILNNYLFIYDVFLPEKYFLKKVSGISSTNLFITREKFLSVGGFDENLVRDEDADLGIRLRKKGYILCQGKETVVFHRFSDKGRSDTCSDHYKTKEKYIKALLETRLLIIAKHSPSILAFIYLLDLFTSINLIYRIIWKEYNLNRIKIVSNQMHVTEWHLIIILLIKSYLRGLKFIVSKNADFKL